MNFCKFDNAVHPRFCMYHLGQDGKDHIAVLCDKGLTEHCEKLEVAKLGFMEIALACELIAKSSAVQEAEKSTFKTIAAIARAALRVLEGK